MNPVHRRILEVVPPTVAWVAITSPAWASIIAPHLLGYFLVAFSAYWFWRSAEFAAGLLIGLGRLQAAHRRDWLESGNHLPGFDRMHHVVIVPTYKESEEILGETLKCLARQTLGGTRIAVVLAFEERDPDAPAHAQRITERFAAEFGEWLVTMHPDLSGQVG